MLYLPKEWTDDRVRCGEAGIGDEVGFATKQVLARRMIERAHAAGVPFAWVTADELYGQDTKFRLWLESRGLAHVVSVPKNAMVVSMELAKVRVDRVIADLDGTRWQWLSCGDGTRGPRVSDWAVVDIRPLRDPRFGHWLLARRSITDPTDGLDHYQVRGYSAWYRHITLSMAAAAFLVILRTAAKKGAPYTTVSPR
jgi:SRSO17 transposase